MADKTKIEWSDATWNPVTGCTEVSPGCDHCYAKTFAERWRGTPGHPYENGFDLTLRPERMDQPVRWKRPRRIFVNSMSDLFHEGVPDTFIVRVFATMALAQQHTFQVLTKRHGRMRSLLSNDGFRSLVAVEVARGNDKVFQRQLVTWPLPNVWLGVSVEDQKRADLRIPALLDTPAAVRWLSCEPLLGPVDLSPWLDPPMMCECPGNVPVILTCTLACRQLDGDARLGWVVAGGESGPGARPMHPGWARSIRDQCERAEVPFLFKQWGAWAPAMPGDRPGGFLGPDGEWRDDTLPRVARLDLWAAMHRVGKGAAGRELDGRTWDEYPDSAEARADDPARPGGTTDGAR